MTFSWWGKKCNNGTLQSVFSATGNDRIQFGANVTDDLTFSTGSGTTSAYTQAVFRDPSAWYHFVISVDTTQATSADRVKIYVNGVQQTLSGSFPTQNATIGFNNAVAHSISRDQASASQYLDAYLTEVNFIDGQALTPSSFGTSNGLGVWQPIRYGGSYGTNGFYLPFTNTTSTTTLGYDFSPQGNNWTTNNISLTAGTTYDSMTDVPTLTSATTANYCVLNGASVGTDATLSNGNLNISYGSSGTRNATMGTIGMSSGKWYAEFSFTSGSFPMFGITSRASSNDIPNYPGFNAFGWGYFVDGDKYTNNTNTAYGATWTTNDVIGVAFDADVGSLTFYKNGISQGVAFTGLTSGTYFFAIGDGGGAATWSGWANFGQRPFSYTPPTGFVALNTFNLPTPTIGATASTTANEYFDASLYTGNSGTQSITNSGSMQPDFVWLKSRSNALDHGLFDSVRGVQNVLASNGTGAANYGGTGELTAFNSNGFTLVNSGSYQTNQSGYTYVAWQWRASNATAVTNTAGTITSTVSANTTAGFSIVKINASGSSGSIGHGLGVAPSMIIGKNTAGADDWYTYHASIGTGAFIRLNTTGAQASSASAYTNINSTTFTAGSGVLSNNAHIFYCFAQVAGYSAFGSYTGNGSTDGAFIFTGFRPKYIMMKSTSTESWELFDTSRSPYNQAVELLEADSSGAENTSSTSAIDILSNGFKQRNTRAATNGSGTTYIYMAFAENPFKYANAR
jgi:hypothetical protein